MDCYEYVSESALNKLSLTANFSAEALPTSRFLHIRTVIILVGAAILAMVVLLKSWDLDVYAFM